MAQKKLHLQGLRGFAIISVVSFHFFPEWCPNGYLGVDQFFLLSGYLMTMMLHRHSSLNFTVILDFLYRRVKRIVPLYYLATSLILASINLMPKSAINTNFTSSIYALLFVTNLIRPLGMEGYAEKLGIAVDMFTHTWSLALEMQFYLLFPFIYILVERFRENRKNYIIIILGSFSFAVYLLSDSFHSFNSVFSRSWQFLAGMLVFSNLTENNNCAQREDLEKQRLVEEEDDLDGERPERADLKKLVKIVTNVSIFSMAILLFVPFVIEPLYGRMNIILLTGLIVYLGEGSALLENQSIIFLGEISYCWYLVHWPVIALCKMNRFTSEIELIYALFASFFISLIIHYGFERFYLKWTKKTIGVVLFFLLLTNGGALFHVYSTISTVAIEPPIQEPRKLTTPPGNLSPIDGYNFDSDHMENIRMGYENITKESRAQLNENFDAHDIKQLYAHPCREIKTKNSKERRCQVSKKENVTGTPLTLLVVGNSWAQNSAGVVHNECQDVFSSIYLSAAAGCEPLFRSVITKHYDCTVDWMFKAAAEEYKPDVLFIITRHINTMEIVNGTNPFDDSNFHTAVQRIRDLEKLVKKKIYILDVFPPPSTSITHILNSYLRKGETFKDSDLIELSPHYLIARERMYRLVQGCSKCQLFDYATQFYFNGEFKIYDPKYHVSFFTKGQHLTPPGLERVRPLLRHLCHHF